MGGCRHGNPWHPITDIHHFLCIPPPAKTHRQRRETPPAGVWPRCRCFLSKEKRPSDVNSLSCFHLFFALQNLTSTLNLTVHVILVFFCGGKPKESNVWNIRESRAYPRKDGIETTSPIASTLRECWHRLKTRRTFEDPKIHPLRLTR